MKTVFFIGATGNLGRPVCEELVRSGFAVTAYVRNLEKARSLLPDPVKLVEGDIADEDRLAAAMAGFDIVYLSLSVAQTERPDDFHPEGAGLENAILAAKRAGVRRVAYLSSLVHRYQGMNGFDWWAFEIKAKAVKFIKRSGIPYTIFYPSTFMEALETARQGKKIAVGGRSPIKMYYVAAQDYAKMVGKALSYEGSDNQEYDIQGAEGMTQVEAAQRYVAAYRKEILGVSVAPMWLFALLRFLSQRFNYLYHILTALNQYPETFNGEKAWEDLGKPVLTIEDFATRH